MPHLSRADLYSTLDSSAINHHRGRRPGEGGEATGSEQMGRGRWVRGMLRKRRRRTRSEEEEVVVQYLQIQQREKRGGEEALARGAVLEKDEEGGGGGGGSSATTGMTGAKPGCH